MLATVFVTGHWPYLCSFLVCSSSRFPIMGEVMPNHEQHSKPQKLEADNQRYSDLSAKGNLASVYLKSIPHAGGHLH